MAWIQIPTRDCKTCVYTQSHMVIEFVYKKSNECNFVGQYYFKNLRHRFAFFYLSDKQYNNIIYFIIPSRACMRKMGKWQKRRGVSMIFQAVRERRVNERKTKDTVQMGPLSLRSTCA